MDVLTNNDASGYLVNTFEGLETEFTDLEELSRSECFVVVRAKRYGRWWVLKALLPEFAEQESHQQMLRKEFEVLMQMQHRFVVQALGMELVLGVGRCIVMEYVAGTRLNDWLEQQPTVAARRHIASCLLETVGFVHANGIVHRDLKPSNIIVTGNGTAVKLIDFGLADTVSHAVLKQPAGTVSYMSPEQMSQHVPDVRNDIYSLGVVLREMDLGGRYDKVIARCLAPIDRRYANVNELLQAITAVRRTRRRWLMALSALALLLLVAAVGWLAANFARPVIVGGVASGTADSLRRELAGRQATYQALGDSMARLATDNQHLHDRVDKQQQRVEQEQQQRVKQRQQLVQQAIARGRHAIDKAAERTAVNAYLDTLSNAVLLNDELLSNGIKAVRHAALDYMVSIKRDFTAEELETIRQSCEAHVNDITNRWLTRINTL